MTSVRSGFPKSKMKTEPNPRPFWEVQNRLSYSDDLVWLDNRIFIPKSYQSQILNYFTQLIRVLPVWQKELTKQYIGRVLPTISETCDATARDVKIFPVNWKNHWLSAKQQNTHFNTYLLIVSKSKETTT